MIKIVPSMNKMNGDCQLTVEINHNFFEYRLFILDYIYRLYKPVGHTQQ